MKTSLGYKASLRVKNKTKIVITQIERGGSEGQGEPKWLGGKHENPSWFSRTQVDNACNPSTVEAEADRSLRDTQS